MKAGKEKGKMDLCIDFSEEERMNEGAGPRAKRSMDTCTHEKRMSATMPPPPTLKPGPQGKRGAYTWHHLGWARERSRCSDDPGTRGSS